MKYTLSQKLLHKILLNSRLFKRTQFEINKLFFDSSDFSQNNNKHIFISGLPRSGSTSLLNFLSLSDLLFTLTYRDMPYLMGPNIFNFLKSKKIINKFQRFHNDNILIDFDSPEALDQVFLSSYDDNEFLEEYKIFINNYLTINNKKRYLSKNNNLSISRLQNLSINFPDSYFLVLFRNPINQVISLYNQHQNFLKLNIIDSFVSQYMDLLGHNEFGVNHKYWFKPRRFKNPTNINYWLEQWVSYFKVFLRFKKLNTNIKFICYENLKNDSYIDQIKSKLDLNIICDKKFFISKNNKNNFSFDDKLTIQSNRIYRDLKIHENEISNN